jgi:hypothetical protein
LFWGLTSVFWAENEEKNMTSTFPLSFDSQLTDDLRASDPLHSRALLWIFFEIPSGFSALAGVLTSHQLSSCWHCLFSTFIPKISIYLDKLSIPVLPLQSLKQLG